MAPWRFGASAFLNSAPLVEGLKSRPDVTLIHDEPSRLAARLAVSQLDAALVPVADVLLDPGLAIIPGIGVCADGEVRSVLLRCRCPLAEVRTLALDPASRTSNRLARILLQRHFHIEASPVAAGKTADAAVVIGDRALTTPPEAGGDLDLARAWREMTGLPFVFAVWAHRADHPAAAPLAAIARASLETGRARRAEIAARYATALGLSSADCLDYLERCVTYEVGDREREAMALFARYLRDEPDR